MQKIQHKYKFFFFKKKNMYIVGSEIIDNYKKVRLEKFLLHKSM